jgi:hypothetical protein
MAGNIKARVLTNNTIRAKQVAVGNSSTNVNLSAKSINELADVNVIETDEGVLKYNATTDKWETSNVLDGGTF